MIHRVRRPHVILSLALAAACSADSSTGPRAPVTLDQALSELSTPALSAAAASFDASGPAIPALAASRCAYQTSSQSFTCTPVIANGVTVTQAFTLFDGAGAKQSAFDQATTSAVRANTSVAGTFQQGAEQFTVDGQQELTLSGLREAIHTLDGTTTVHVTSTGGTLPYETTVTTTITGLKLQPPTADGTHPWPKAGTIVLENSTAVGGTLPFETTVTTTITGLKLQPPTADGTHPWPKAGAIVVENSTSIGGAVPAVIRATITFNGTSKVTVNLVGPGVSGTCTIDLASQAPNCS